MNSVHPTAVVYKGAELGDDVVLGPGAVIGQHVKIGDGTTIGAHAIVDGHTTIGKMCKVFPHAVLGTAPQDLKYSNEPTSLVLGDRNIIREFVTIHRGTPQGRGVTTVGSDVFLMAYCHVAHDNILADNVIVANNSQLAGHVKLDEFAIVGGVSAIHQFVRVGPHAFIGGGSVVVMDVPPFCKATGNRARLHGINTIGLKRRGFDESQLRAVRKAYKLAFHSNLLVREAVERIEEDLLQQCPDLHLFTEFLSTSERGVTR